MPTATNDGWTDHSDRDATHEEICQAHNEGLRMGVAAVGRGLSLEGAWPAHVDYAPRGYQDALERGYRIGYRAAERQKETA